MRVNYENSKEKPMRSLNICPMCGTMATANVAPQRKKSGEVSRQTSQQLKALGSLQKKRVPPMVVGRPISAIPKW